MIFYTCMDSYTIMSNIRFYIIIISFIAYIAIEFSIIIISRISGLLNSKLVLKILYHVQMQLLLLEKQ